MGSALVDSGHRVAHAQTVYPEGEQAPAPAAVLTGYVLIAAEDLDAATRLASGCPGLTSGVSVEIAETVDA